MTRWLGISLGDVTGVGPEVALKAITAEAGLDEVGVGGDAGGHGAGRAAVKVGNLLA